VATTSPPLNRARNHLNHPPSPPLGPPSLLRAAARNRGRLALGVFLVAVFSLLTATFFSGTGDRRAVLALRNAVAVGTPIQASDLTVVRVSADPGVRVVPASERSKIVGRLAAVALAPGTLLSPTQLGGSPGLAAGRAVVGLALKPGQYPPDLRPGDSVLVVITPAAMTIQPADGSAGDLPVLRSKVTSVQPRGPADPAEIVSVEIPEENVPAVIAAASAGRTSLARTGTTP